LEEALASGARLLSIDSMEPVSEAAAGRLIWENRDRLGFVAGSQGVEYALVRHWIATGMLAPAAPVRGAGRVEQIAAVSGSVSPMTATQLDWARQNGFALLEFDARAACGSEALFAQRKRRLVGLALEAAGRGSSPLVHSAAGPDDPAVTAFRDTLARSAVTPETANRRIGEALGRILDRVLRETGIRRAVISGGDTSGHGMRQLGLEALVGLAPTIPGAALCTAYGSGPHDAFRSHLRADRWDPRTFSAGFAMAAEFAGNQSPCGRAGLPSVVRLVPIEGSVKMAAHRLDSTVGVLFLE
jgi:uncharacterized protein YgbK (DUF1537 family)